MVAVAASGKSLAAGEDLAGFALGADAGGDVHTSAEIVAAAASGFALVEADPNLRCETGRAAMLVQSSLDGYGAFGCVGGSGKGDEEAVAAVLNLLPGVLSE